MKRLILVLGILTLLLFQIRSQSLAFNIGLEIENLYYRPDILMDGVFTFENKLDEKIKLPRSFDLSVQIFDKTNKLLPINNDIAFEYANLIASKKRIRIKPNSSINIHFTEWRLFAYPLKIGDEYKIQYLLKPDLYPGLRKHLDERTIMTNKATIQIPDKQKK